jgi:hypothetical protein
MATAELLVFLYAVLPELERTELEERLRTLPGVLAVHLGHEHPRTLTLNYDSDRIHADAILSAVRQRDPQAALPGL